ncbi:hypothetical protein COO60DRAFT_1626921 [Scenedesmus sp. NREL 46B-D3]|nr:hypothetical protein COO60DRAFT_1626921 [Scenedesmus sp. NREL 46B-D3]
MAGLSASFNASVLILCGAINALLSKVVYQLQGQDCSGDTKPFAKPWLQTALMFVAMAFCLPIGWGMEAWQQRKKKSASSNSSSRARKLARAPSGIPGATVAAASGTSDLSVPLLAARAQDRLQQQQHREDDRENDGEAAGSGAKSILKEGLMLCIPTGFDLAATTLMNWSRSCVVFQILRGSEMLFAALFAVLFLKRRLNRWHFLGVGLCMVGISLVGVSRVLAAGDDSSGGGSDSLQDPLGAIQAGQVTVEDHFMSEMGMHPLKVVGWEGVIGSAVMLGGALPLLQRLPFEDGSGLAEDSRGSWCMVASSPSIAVVLFLSSFAVLVYNVSGMYVTEQVGAAARTVLENARTVLVWLAALGLYYMHVGGGDGGVSIGEAWDSWSWLQAVGFAVFATGALLYDKGHKQEEEASVSSGEVPKYSKWAVLKSTLNIHTGHFVGLRTFRAAANSVMAAQRLARLAEEDSSNGPSDEAV